MVKLFKIIILFISINAISVVKADDKDQTDKLQLRHILQNISSFSAEFSQTITNEMGETLQTSNGKMILGKPNKLRWQVTNPDESLLIADGNAVYNIDPFVEQVTILNQDTVIQNNPLALLMNDNESTWQDVEVKKNAGYYTVIPLSPDANITSLKLVFDERQRLVELTATDMQGQINQIEFENIKINPMLSLNQFIAETPASYMVDDQR